MKNYNNKRIAVVGLGYVGLPLAIEFGKKRNVIGFDTNHDRVSQLKNCQDITLEVDEFEIKSAVKLCFTSNLHEISDCNIFIVTVPTPIDKKNQPDLKPLIEASKSIGSILTKGDIVIYESTVFPGATEEICVPILEKASGFKFNKDFFCGYSPERINPGDKTHRINNIKKVTSGSLPEIEQIVDDLYQQIITAGTYKAGSIKIAEASKVIENTQRDVNIALINELSMIFNRLGIDTESVLKAAKTKWNFISFSPGLVGGHCIGVDPYYLTYKSLQLGYKPEMILAGRKINDNMGSYVSGEVVKLMHKKGIDLKDSNVLIFGFAFKENCPDIRNSRVIDLLHEFQDLNCNVDIYDPWIDKNEAIANYNFEPIEHPKLGFYDAIVLAVAHEQFRKMHYDEFRKFAKDKFVIYDVKYLLDKNEVDGRL